MMGAGLRRLDRFHDFPWFLPASRRVGRGNASGSSNAMDCPKCHVKLARDEYENAAVYLCTSCSGYLIKRNRLLLIKQSRERSERTLRREAESEADADSTEPLRCPRCRVERMRKEKVRVEPEGEFLLDVCKRCDYLWFDGGELARWQLDHEAGESAREAEEFRRRVESRSEEEQAAMERRLAETPGETSVFSAAFQEVLLIAAAVVGLLLTLGALFFDSTLWATVGSLTLAIALGLLVPRFLHTRNTALAAYGALVVGEAAFLLFLFVAG